MTANARFIEFLQDIEPSATTTANASAAHTSMRDFLRSHDVIGGRHVETYLSGSYKRNTAIRPKKGTDGKISRPDVDIIMVTNHKETAAPADVIHELHEAIASEYDDVELQFRSVGVKTAAAEMDVVPIIEPYGEGGGLFIPDRNLKKWLPTNPPGHTEWTTERNAAANGRFKPLVKMFKWWRRHNHEIGLLTEKRPKGFMLECMAAACMDYQEAHYGELFTKTFESIVSTYGLYVAAGMKPVIPDPGVPQNDVLSNVSFAEFNDFFKLVRAHAVRAREAMKNEDSKIWRDILGQNFPLEVEKAAAVQDSSVRLGSVAVGGTGLLEFPNKPVTPNTSKGFA